MEPHVHESGDSCKTDVESCSRMRDRLIPVTEAVIDSCSDEGVFTHIGDGPIPDKARVIEIVERFRNILFPGYFGKERLDSVNFRYGMGQSVSQLFDLLSDQITKTIRHDCFRYSQPCSLCVERGYEVALEMLRSIPDIRRMLATDIQAAFEGDPAAKSHDEIIFSYPGIFAMATHRVAHRLFDLGVPLLPRMIAEHAHSVTGIDIHPGAEIGESFAVDHGTGVVIGETTVIGRNVRIYQGVTLGALSLPRDAGRRLKGKKRHPTIEEDVIIYSGATILGGETVIGARSVVGGNVWITESVPPDTKVIMEPPKLVYR